MEQQQAIPLWFACPSRHLVRLSPFVFDQVVEPGSCASQRVSAWVVLLCLTSDVILSLDFSLWSHQECRERGTKAAHVITIMFCGPSTTFWPFFFQKIHRRPTVRRVMPLSFISRQYTDRPFHTTQPLAPAGFSISADRIPNMVF